MVTHLMGNNLNWNLCKEMQHQLWSENISQCTSSDEVAVKTVHMNPDRLGETGGYEGLAHHLAAKYTILPYWAPQGTASVINKTN